MRFSVYSAIRACCSLGDSLLQPASAIGELTLYYYTSLPYCASFSHTWKVVENQVIGLGFGLAGLWD